MKKTGDASTMGTITPIASAPTSFAMDASGFYWTTKDGIWMLAR
ncbi:MAG TPA: hypothetical protein VM925_20095 [Labilithrix sp.]|nr:hypothetical protein [Labilithrix sp.]